MRNMTALLLTVLIAMLSLTACQDVQAPTSSLCGAVHPIGWTRAELLKLSTDRLRELQTLNCSIERACHYDIDKGCAQ